MHEQYLQISRFLANEFGLAGKNNTEKAQADEVVDAVVDLQNAAVNISITDLIFPSMFLSTLSSLRKMRRKRQKRQRKCLEKLFLLVW